MTFRKRRDRDSVLKLWICVTEDDNDAFNTGWLSRSQLRMIKPNTAMSLLSVGSTTNVVRQYEALKSLPHLKPHLRKALFTSQLAGKASETSKRAPKPTSLPSDVWKSLQMSHNAFQINSIAHLMSGRCRENLSLTQGP